MPAYVIVETDVTDPEQYERYRAAGAETVAAAGGRYLVRGGELAVLEGDWEPSRLVMLEFEDLEAATRCTTPSATGRPEHCAKVRRGCAWSPRTGSSRDNRRRTPQEKTHRRIVQSARDRSRGPDMSRRRG